MPLRLFLVLGAAWVATFGVAQHFTANAGVAWAPARRQHTLVTPGPADTEPHPSVKPPVAASAQPTAQLTAEPKTYTVQPGDTLYGIAAVTGLSVATLLTLNGLDSALIYPGQVLRLEPPHVTVKRGDTLWALAQKQHVSIAALRAANGLGRSAVLHPGDTLVIPPRPATATATDKADIGGAAVRTVTVAKGDTLSSLARRYHTTAATLIAVNGLSGSELRVGQSLRVVPTPPTYAFRRAIPPPVTGLIWPLVGAITSPFGARDFRVAGSSFHTGLDIDGHTGDPVRAAVGGTVIFSGWNAQGYGNLLIVHVGDADYFYAHCSKLLVKKGATVRQGQVIALVGATGDATGSHLHFEIRVNDTPINPLPFLTQHVSAP